MSHFHRVDKPMNTRLKEFVLVAVYFLKKCPKAYADIEKGLLYLEKQEVEPKL